MEKQHYVRKIVVPVTILAFFCTPVDAFEVRIGQVIPDTCPQQRYGTKLAVEFINRMNDGQGFPVDFEGKVFGKFVLHSREVNTTVNAGPDYEAEHLRQLEDLFNFEQVHFMAGTCSMKSEIEKVPANNAQRILMAMVGPDAYYEDRLDYIFGMHVSNYRYTEPSLKELSFQGAKTVAIAGRKESLFYKTTCAEGEKHALRYGMTLAMPRIEFEASGDASQVSNTTFQEDIARQMCESGADVYFGCVDFAEAKVWLRVWKEMGCRPKALWLTCSSWGWYSEAGENSKDGAYLIGAGQWHKAMPYTDNVIGNASNFYTQFEKLYGFTPTYDAVAAYTGVFIYMRAIQRVLEGPMIQEADDIIEDKYEEIRRALIVLVESRTIYGPVEFDLEYKRNIGRMPMNMQFLPHNGAVQDFCIAPADAANALLKYPAPTSETCATNTTYDSQTSDACFLCSKCVAHSDKDGNQK